MRALTEPGTLFRLRRFSGQAFDARCAASPDVAERRRFPPTNQSGFDIKECLVRATTRLFCLIVFIVCSWGASRPLLAEQPAPEVTIVQSGAEELLLDLKYLLGLTNKEEQTQWESIEGIMETFLSGIDRKRPVRIDLILASEVVRYRPNFPYDDLEAFIDNLGSFGIAAGKLGNELYELKGDFKGFMRTSNGYASIGEKKDDVPADLADPLAAVKDIAAKYDFAAVAANSAEAADTESRQKAMAELHKELTASIKKKKEETDDEFAMRKMLFEHQFDEVQRLFVQAASLTLGWTTDRDKSEGRFDVDLTALPETELAATVQELGSAPSRFAEIAASENSILHAKVNHPLDEMRKKHFLEFFGQLRPMIAKELEGVKDLKDTERAASIKISDHVFDMLEAGAKMGIVDGFVNIDQDKDKKFELTGAIRVADSAPVADMLKLLPEAGSGQTVEMNVAEQGDVKIHKAVLAADSIIDLKPLFGEKVTMFVGYSADAVWYAAGGDALERLKAAIAKGAAAEVAEAAPQAEKKAEEPKADADKKADADAKPADAEKAKADADVKPAEGKKAKADAAAEKPAQKKATAGGSFFLIELRVFPWVELREKKIADEKIKRMLTESLSTGEDKVSIDFSRVEERIEGRVKVDQGILRLVGKIMADVSKENF